MIKKEIEGAALLSIYNELKDEIKAIRAYSGGYPFSISGDIRSVPS